jgi:hypothetical protein
MREMLTDQSFESFRAYSLDSIARLDEALIVADDIRRDRLPKQAFEPVLSELAWSLATDPVAKDVASPEISSFRELLKGDQATTDETARHLTLLRKKIGKYYKTSCETKILMLIDNHKQRIDLRNSTGFYCSHLLNIGHSKTYLLRKVEEIFFTSPMRNVGRRTLEKFFGFFDTSPKTFFVYTVVDAAFGRYLTKLELEVYPNAARLRKGLDRGVAQHLPIQRTHAYLFSRVDAYDQDAAVAAVEHTLTSVRALAFLVPHGMEFTSQASMYAVKGRSRAGVILSGHALPLQRSLVAPSANRKTFKSLTSYSGRVLSHFDSRSTERIISSLNTSALARTSQNIENQLISLWSAIEVLLTEPPAGVVRIVHYTKLLLPCICLRYIRRQAIAIFNEMLIVYRKRFARIVNSEPNFSDQHTKFAAILLLSSNSPLRDQLVGLCSENPLALHRLWKLQRDFSSPQPLKVALEEHERRVGWQLHRIYRARNSLVHSGTKPSYLDSLVLNLDEYYRACLGTLVNRASREEDDSDIDQLTAEIGIEYKIYMTSMGNLRREVELSPEIFIRAIM